MDKQLQAALQEGIAIPAVPLALREDRTFDERRQRALLRYYAAAGVGGVAIGVHTTQFAIRDPKHGLFEPVIRLAASVCDELDRGLEGQRSVPLVRVGGICGETPQAVKEAELLKRNGYHLGLLNLGALRTATEPQVVAHCRQVAEIIPLFGFFLNPNIGGRELSYNFWRSFAEIENARAIKIACFDRYKTIDCVRGIAESGRDDIALYTGNDDNILLDFLTPFRFRVGNRWVERHIVGGLLGHWAVWTKRGVELLTSCRAAVRSGTGATKELLQLANEVTDANAAFFDPAHSFAGCIPGLHTVLVKQGLLEGAWCLNPAEQLSAGQREEIERVHASYPHLNDDAFVAEHRKRWLLD
jgi:dihydrodipicolinate synthase/N-acetylneuraminate lyase